MLKIGIVLHRTPNTMPIGHISSLQIGMPQQRPALSDRQPAYQTGFWKSPVAGRLLLDAHGLEGDGQADLINHGGTDKALCIYSASHYPSWKTELQRDDFSYGAFGENLTVTGDSLHETEVCVGDLWAIGTARLQVSQPRQPCWKLGRRWEMTDLPGKVIQSGKTGWYLRVIQPGTLSQGDEIALIARPAPAWPISRLNQLMYRDKQNISQLKDALALPFLSASWRETFMNRLHSS